MAMQVHTTSAFAFGSAVAGGTALTLAEFEDIGGTLILSASRIYFQTAGSVRFRYDGGTPTAAAGEPWFSTNGRLEVLGANNIRRFRVIAASGTPVMFVTLEG